MRPAGKNLPMGAKNLPTPRPRTARARALAALALLVALAPCGWCDPTTGDQAKAFVAAWLARDPEPLGEAMPRLVKGVATYRDEKGSPLYHVVALAPSGFVVVAGDDLVEPVIAFSAEGAYRDAPDNALAALLGRDLPERLRQAKALIHQAHQVNPRLAAIRSLWDPQPLATGDQPFERTSSVSDVRVPPLVETRWSQTTVAGSPCYNYYTPNNYPCGCVATAMAQLMRYFQHPSEAVGTRSFTVYVDGQPEQRSLLGGDGQGGPYRWDQMPFVPTAALTEAQRQAIGAICHDAGITVNMMYSASGSGAYTLGGRQLVEVFGYSNAIEGRSPSGLRASLKHMVNTNLDAGRPVALGIFGPSGGHAIVCDGYGVQAAVLYHHLNLGWAGAYDAWYNLPNIDAGYQFDSVDICVYNIYIHGSGEIISGRVTDEEGNPIEGAIVTAERAGGGSYSATTNSRGIYFLEKLPSNSTYTLACQKAGYAFAQRQVTIGRSTTSSSATGNLWGVDFGGPPPLEITTTALPAGVVGSAYSAALAASGGTQPYHWRVLPLEAPATGRPQSGGAPQGWRADDRAWTYALPFPFPYAGSTYTTVYVCSNGFLDFASTYADYSNSASELGANLRIAPLWDDLRTDGSAQWGEDIYIRRPDAQSVAFRWVAETYGTRRPVEFEVILRADGAIEFRYGDGNSSLSPTVGLGFGHEGIAVLSSYDGAASLASADAVAFKPLHPGLALDQAAGQIGGVPAVADARALRFVVEDAGGQRATRDLTLRIDPEPLPPLVVTATANPTSGFTPLTVHFNAQVSGGEVQGLRWDFGDGEMATVASPTHLYEQPGTYVATVTVTDTDSRTAQASVQIEVQELPPLTVTARAEPTSGSAPLSVAFTATVEGVQAIEPVNFDNQAFLSYGAAQDRAVEVQAAGSDVSLRGNGWKAIPLHYNVTPNTVLMFEFRSDYEGDIHAIGLDTNLHPTRYFLFQLHGTQPYAIHQAAPYRGGWQAYVIPVGAYYTGEMNYLVFVNDHDVSEPFAESRFRNIRFYERNPRLTFQWDFGDGATSTSQTPSHTYDQPGTYLAEVVVTDQAGRRGSASVAVEVEPPPPLEVEIEADPAAGYAPLEVSFSPNVAGAPLPGPLDLSAVTIWSYGGRAQDRAARVTIEDQGRTIHIQGNGWKALRAPYIVTRNTVLSFEFRSDWPGEIHAIGLDDNLVPTRSRIFQLCGTDRYARPIGPPYQAGRWQAYEIPVGQFLSGRVRYLALINDHDVRYPTAESRFRNIRLYERDPGLQYHWDFGDGATSTSACPIHTYRQPGTWQATLVVRDAIGRQGSATVGVEVQEPPPLGVVADAEPAFGQAPLVVSFAASVGSIQAAQPPLNLAAQPLLSYGGPAQDRALRVAYENNGTTLRLVGNGWKAIHFPYTITPNTILAFDYRSDRQGEIQGIGFDTNLRITRRRIFQLYGIHRFGNYQGLRYQPGRGDGWMSYEIPVGAFYTGRVNFLVFVNDQDVARPNAESRFRNIRVIERQPGRRWAWDFGDGATSTLQAPTHTYAQPGIYAATVSVTDPDGASGSDIVFVQVEDGGREVALVPLGPPGDSGSPAPDLEVVGPDEITLEATVGEVARAHDALLLRNCGSQPLEVILLVAPPFGLFAGDGEPATELTLRLEPGAEAAIGLAFAPPTEGRHVATLIVSSPATWQPSSSPAPAEHPSTCSSAAPRGSPPG